ncbi:MAG: Flp pilus assembly protein TadD, partial [Candidatus Omnitrophota bacterium]
MNKFFYSPSKKQSLLCLSAVLTLVVCAFWPLFQATFVNWGDYANVVNNELIRSLSNPNIKALFKVTTGSIYTPLTTLSWALEYRFFKLNPFIFHLNNILLHLGVVVFVFLTSRRVGLSVIAASVTSLLFGIHPLHVESVAWISQRKDVLGAFFYMATVYGYLFHLEQYMPHRLKNTVKYNRYMMLVTLLGVLSILSNPMALSLPFILILFDWFKERKGNWRILIEKLPLISCIGIITWINYATYVHNIGFDIKTVSLVWPWTFIFYIKQFILPFVLVPIYHLPEPVAFTNFEYIFSCAVFATLVVAFVYFNRYKWFVFAVLYYFFSIFFLLRFDVTDDLNIVSDRFMYLPSLGICLLLGYAFDRIINRGRASRNILIKIVPIIFVCGLFIWFGVKTYHQSKIWRTGEDLWQHQLKNNPEEHTALTRLALALMQKAEYQEAITQYRQVLELNVTQDEIKNVQGVNDMFKRVDSIERLFKQSIAINPKDMDTYYNMGYFYEAVGADDKALLHYVLTASIEPEYEGVYERIGGINIRNNRPSKAVAAYQKAIE